MTQNDFVLVMGRMAHCNVDSPDEGTGIICGYTLDLKYYIIGFSNDYGCVLTFNPKKVELFRTYANMCQSFRFSKIEHTVFN